MHVACACARVYVRTRNVCGVVYTVYACLVSAVVSLSKKRFSHCSSLPSYINGDLC